MDATDIKALDSGHGAFICFQHHENFCPNWCEGPLLIRTLRLENMGKYSYIELQEKSFLVAASLVFFQCNFSGTFFQIPNRFSDGKNALHFDAKEGLVDVERTCSKDISNSEWL